MFHIKSKHKKLDNFYGQYYNPAFFEDLIVGSKWQFNSSAAEMMNTWFGGFYSIIHEMLKDCYDFFLDEMIR